MWPIHRRRFLATFLGVITLAVGYVLSSGPALAIAFCLREATGLDGFYAAIYLYLPPLVLGGGPAKAYIEWWVNLFGTVGPG